MRDDPYNHKPQEDSAEELKRQEEIMLQRAKCDIDDVPLHNTSLHFTEVEEFNDWLDELERERAEDWEDEKALRKSRKEQCE